MATPIARSLPRMHGGWLVCSFFVQFVLTLGMLCASPTWAQDALGRHYEAAQASLRGGDQERASVEYKAFLSEALHRVANAHAHSGDLSLAAQTFEDALAISEPDSAMRLDYASVLFDWGRLKESAEQAGLVAAAEPGNVRAQVLLGRVAFEQKDYPAARPHLEAAAAGGQFSEVWRILGITYLRLHQLDAARSLLRKVTTELGDKPQTRVAVATTYYYGDYPDLAVEELKKVIAQDNTAPDAHYFLGLAYLGHNEEAGYARAVPEFQAQLKIQPNDFPSRYMLGYIALEKRDFATAETELLRAETIRPSDEGTQLSLGQLYSETRRGAQAEAVLRKLVGSQPDGSAPNFTIVRAHYMLGRLLQQNGRADEGAAQVRTSEQLRKQLRDSSTEAAEGHEHGARKISAQDADEISARAKVSPADQQRAQAFIQQLSPLLGEAYYNLAGISARRQDSAHAEQYLQKAVEWDPALGKARNP